MKNSFFVLVSAILLMVVTSCVDNIEPPVAFSVNSMTLCPGEQYSIVSKSDSSATAIDSLVASMPKTKAPVSSFPTDFGITLSAYYNASIGTSQAYFLGVDFSRNTSGVWAPSTTKYWPQTGSLNFLGFAKKDLSVSSVSWNADPSYQVSMAVGDNSSLQEDLMFCGAASVSKQTTAYPLTFRHAMANLQFTVAAPDGAYNSSDNTGITVSSIKLVNVYNSGTVTATRSASNVSFSWSSLGNQKNLTAPGISSASVATTSTALGSGLVVVPQTCVGVQIEYVLHNGKDGAGTAVNTTRTYTYTPSGTWDAGNKYTIAFSIAQGQISATTSITAWADASQPWFFATGNTVSHLGSNFSFASSNLPNIWWRLDGSSSYEPLTYVEGTWGSSVKLEAQDYYVTVSKSGSNYAVAYETKVPPIDLSFFDINGNSLASRNTANCYVVRESGRYMLPLVYGNAIKDGVANTAAYTNNGGSNTANFVNHLGNAITAPYIEQNTNCTVGSAGLLWQTTRSMISNVGIYIGNDCKYLTFTIDASKNSYGDGDAVVYVKDTNGNVMWSWLIWLTNETIGYYESTNSNGAVYKLMDLDLGAITNNKTNRYKSPLYQWGRKDPFPPTYNYTRSSPALATVYDINNNAVSLRSTSSAAYNNTILNPDQGINNFSPAANFWNATANGYDFTESSMRGQVKTVYDPCPYEYMIPGLRAYYGLGKPSSYADYSNGYGTRFYNSPSTYDNTSFYTADPQVSYNFSLSEAPRVFRWLFARGSSQGYAVYYSYDYYAYQRNSVFTAVYATANLSRVRPCHEFDMPVVSTFTVTGSAGSNVLNNVSTVTFSDGSSQDVSASSSWDIVNGHIQASYVYDGQTFTATDPNHISTYLQSNSSLFTPYAVIDGYNTSNMIARNKSYPVYYAVPLANGGTKYLQQDMTLSSSNTSSVTINGYTVNSTSNDGSSTITAYCNGVSMSNTISLSVRNLTYELHVYGVTYVTEWAYRWCFYRDNSDLPWEIDYSDFAGQTIHMTEDQVGYRWDFGLVFYIYLDGSLYDRYILDPRGADVFNYFVEVAETHWEAPKFTGSYDDGWNTSGGYTRGGLSITVELPWGYSSYEYTTYSCRYTYRGDTYYTGNFYLKAD